ncbi:hypothetical protein Tco_0522205 [Tanacetum coccineum]
MHLVFHVFELKAYKGDNPTTQQALLEVDDDVISDKPQDLLARKSIKKGIRDAEYVLVHWDNASKEDASCESLANMLSSYPRFNGILKDKNQLEGKALIGT